MFGGRAGSLCSNFVGSRTSHSSSLVQDADQDSASVNMLLGTREHDVQMLQHTCDDIAACRAPWLVLVRPRSAPNSTACAWGAGAAAAADMAARCVCGAHLHPALHARRMQLEDVARCCAVLCSGFVDLHKLFMTCACGSAPQPLARTGR